MVRFTWTQIKGWEEEALRARVPQNVPGLIPRSIASNHRWFRRVVSFERNGEKNILNGIFHARVTAGLFVFCALYNAWRVVLWGWTELVEQHSYNFDNIVYDKLSTRNGPYIAPIGIL